MKWFSYCLNLALNSNLFKNKTIIKSSKDKSSLDTELSKKLDTEISDWSVWIKCVLDAVEKESSCPLFCTKTCVLEFVAVNAEAPIPKH